MLVLGREGRVCKVVGLSGGGRVVGFVGMLLSVEVNRAEGDDGKSSIGSRLLLDSVAVPMITP